MRWTLIPLTSAWLLACGPSALPAARTPLTATAADAFGAQVPAVEEAPVIQVPELTEITLPSGLQVWSAHMPSSREASLAFVSRRANSVAGPCEREVLAVTMPAIANHARRERPLEEITEVSSAGAGRSGTLTSLGFGSPVANTPALFAALSRVLNGPTPDERAVELARASIVEYVEHEKRFEYARRATEWVFGFKDGELRLDPEKVKAVTVEDVAACRNQVLTVQDAAVVVAGPGAPEQVQTLATEHLGDFTRRGKAWTPPQVRMSFPEQTRVRLYPFRGVQTRLAVLQPSPRLTDQDRWPFWVLAYALAGGGATSRLNAKVRRQLNATYGVSISMPGLGTQQALHVDVPVEPSQVREALDAVLEELTLVQNEPITDHQLRSARMALQVALSRRFASAGGVAGWAAQEFGLAEKQRLDWRQVAKDIASITAEDVQRVARRYLKPGAAAVTLGGRWISVRRHFLGSDYPLTVHDTP